LKPTPPHNALKFLRWFCREDYIEEVEGDLIEVFEKQSEDNPATAKRKFRYSVIRYFRPEFIRTFKPRYQTNNYGMLKNYFKIGYRNLTKNKGYSFINIGGLSFGITVAMLIGLWVYNETSYDRHNPSYDKIAQVIQNVTNNGEVETWKNVPFPLSEELRANYSDDFKHIGMVVNWSGHMLTHGDKTLNHTGAYFEKEATKMLALDIAQGTADFEDPASILLSASTAKTYFGDDDPINKIMKLGQMPDMKVIGIYEDIPAKSTFAGLEFITSWTFLYNNEDWFKNTSDPWRPNFVSLYVELNDKVNLSAASDKIKDAKLKKVNEQLAQKKPTLFLHPMRNWHLRSEFKNGVNTGGAIQYVWMFGIIGLFVLLLACINFMNLSTARNEIRAKEVGIRKTIGSSRKQLIIQFFIESLLIVTFSFVISIFLAQLLLPYFNEVAHKQIVILWNSPSFWLTSMSFILLTAIVAGSYPAFYLSSFKPVQVLKGTFKAGKYASVPRKVLVVFQFTVSITLIIGTIVVYQQIEFAKNRPVGYSRNNLVSIPTRNSSIHNHFEAVKEELMQSNMITAIAESRNTTTSIWGTTSGLSWVGKDANLSTDFGMVNSSYDYGKTIEWDLIAGRDFSREFASDSSALILNEAAIRFMGLKNPVGAPVTWWDSPYTVIGVIKDMVMQSPYEDQKPVIYFLSRGRGNIALLKLNPSVSATKAIDKIESVFKNVNPTQPFEYQFVDDDYNRKFGNEERVGKLSSFFALLGVLICCFGIFGLASFTAAQRTKEIGIRKVMGASVAIIWQLLTKEFVLLVLLSTFIAIPLSYYFLNQWLLNYTYHTELSWLVFVVAGSTTLVITLLTVSHQAIKAAISNPIDTLRAE
jgi:ABC-type antimicrobial peptide transport system permease subunit